MRSISTRAGAGAGAGAGAEPEFIRSLAVASCFEVCLTDRLVVAAVFVSGYTRHVNITDSEFSWIGCNPMASWVSTTHTISSVASGNF